VQIGDAGGSALLSCREAFVQLYRLGSEDSRTAPKYEATANGCGAQNEHKDNDVALSLYEWRPASDLKITLVQIFSLD